MDNAIKAWMDREMLRLAKPGPPPEPKGITPYEKRRAEWDREANTTIKE